MRANIISAGSLGVAMTLQASAAPTQNWKRALELDLSEIDNRAYDLLDSRQERSFVQRVGDKVTAFVKSPTVQAIGSAVGSAAIAAAMNRIIKRDLELDLSEIENRDLDLDELEVREPQRRGRPAARSGMRLPSSGAFRATLQRISTSPTAGRFLRTAAQGARRIVSSPTMRTFAHGAGRAMRRVFGPRSLEADAPELSARDLELLEELLEQREFDDLSELYERQGPGASSRGKQVVNWAKNSQTLRDFGKSVVSGALTGVAGSISPIRREFNPVDDLELSERDLDDLLELVNRDLELNELD